MKMPQASPNHFRDKSIIPQGVDPKLIRISTDSYIRSQLVAKRLAYGLQSPIGRDGTKSILLLYPKGDAPATPIIHRGRKNFSTRESVKESVPYSTEATLPFLSAKNGKVKRLPTIEDLKAIVRRVEAIEGHVGREHGMSTEKDMEALQGLIAEAKPDDLLKLYTELAAVLDKKQNAQAHIRREAFRRMGEDLDFEQHEFLTLIAVD